MGKAFILIFLIVSGILRAEFHYTISPISDAIKNRMVKGNSWHKGCPVSLRDLRYIRVSYRDFDGVDRIGELIMHHEAAEDIVAIFGRLYEIGYPVRQMRLVSDFGGNDWRSIEADNTSAFNCRNATGSKKWSKHAYGRAIDLNPIENPYISKSGHIAHKASLKYRKRVHHSRTAPSDRALLLQNDKAVRVFKSYGWKWGGDWQGVKDYQHFVKP
jgi:poly-gamma-glutamate synthesis protein (capsule biosynthesis protein)